MGKFLITGQLSKKELEFIRNDMKTCKYQATPAGIYNSSTGSSINPDVRMCLTATPDINQVPRTYNILQSIVLEHYSHLHLKITTVGELQYARYDVGGKFNWHGDIINKPNDTLLRGLTLSVQLTDPSEYDGGELLINDHGNIITCDKTPGVYTIFPAYTKHQVNEITRGCRESIVAWIYLTEKEIKWLRNNDK